jgi:hypothetical protein
VTKITVNGVTYESVDAMPPDVRRVYDQTVANLPELADRDGDGIPDIVQGDGLSVRRGTTVRKKFIVNGTSYDDLNAMPPDVRQAYEKAMRAMSAGGPTVTKNEIKMSFQVTGPGFSFRKGLGAPSASQPGRQVVGPISSLPPGEGVPMPRPIEPASPGGGSLVALLLGACAVVGLIAWLVMRAR